MTADKNCRGHTTPANNKKLEDFVVIPGETLEASIARAISCHIADHRFAEIIRVVSKKRLEIAIAEMELTDTQRKLMYELLGLAAFPVEGFAAKMMSNVTRTALRNKLARMLQRGQMLVIQAYEHHLQHDTMPVAPAWAPESVFGVVH